jgi:putative ABC transport system permease protein
MGIRKALGATSASIVTLLSKDFLKLVGVAFVVATPLAYWGMQQWLASFAYRVDLGVGVFVLAGGAALLIALLTVSTQAIRAARTDPATTLRSE